MRNHLSLVPRSGNQPRAAQPGSAQWAKFFSSGLAGQPEGASMNVQKLITGTDVAKATATIEKAIATLEAEAPKLGEAQRVEVVRKVFELRRSLQLDRVPRGFGRGQKG